MFSSNASNDFAPRLHNRRTQGRDASSSIGLLIADGHELLRADLRKTFGHSDITVVGEAASPQQVKRLARGGAVSVLLLDLAWGAEPVSLDEGMELLGDIRAACEQLPIIVYSVHDDRLCIKRCRQLGANAYLVKGVDDHALVSAVHIVHEGGDAWPERRSVWTQRSSFCAGATEVTSPENERSRTSCS